MNRGGFALPLALAVLVAVSILSVTALQVALADFQANRGARFATKALFAAEAGAERTVATWSSGPYSSLAPGDSASGSWVTLPDGSRYRSVVLRVDDGSIDEPLYRVLTEGRPSRASTARRQLITMLTGGATTPSCCRGAITVQGDLTLRGSGDDRRGRGTTMLVDGRDHVPTIWAGYCPAPGAAVAGVVIEREDDLSLSRGADVEGSPPVLEDRSIGSDVADVFGAMTYAELAARANIRFDRDERTGDEIRPRARRGECDTTDERNWGAPEVPGSLCWDYLPIIHAEGDLRIDDGGQGQRILLVDGDLEVRSDFRFYGLVVVRGEATWREESVLSGGLVIRNRSNGRGRSDVRDDSGIEYNSCAIARASPGGGGVRLVAGRNWFEVP